MENEKVKSLSFDGRRYQFGEKILNYSIEYEGGKTTVVSINLPLKGRLTKTDEIIFENESFVNGFKVVKTKNGEYGYVREEDNALLPYRYDVALDFNEYGLAMVGKDGYVTWINRNFEYLNSLITMSKYEEEYYFLSFEKINAFSKGEIPLSLLIQQHYDIYIYYYIDILGKLKSFKEYNEGYPALAAFLAATPFNEQGYARADDYILSSKGYMISKSDLKDKSLNAGLPDSIFEFAKETKKNERTLKR